jgi:hypothetical protein
MWKGWTASGRLICYFQFSPALTLPICLFVDALALFHVHVGSGGTFHQTCAFFDFSHDW